MRISARGGGLASRKLSDEDLARYQGILGHWHIQTDKVDPGPAFQWDYLIRRARQLFEGNSLRPAFEKGASRLVRSSGRRLAEEASSR
jgi:hypothetical protein